MPAPRNRKHILVGRGPSAEPFRPHNRMIRPRAIPAPPDRRLHANTLKAALQAAQQAAQQGRTTQDVVVHGATPGLYIQFESQPGVELKLDSLENRTQGIELVAVQAKPSEDEPEAQLATVFVPDGRLRYFVTRFDQYATQQTRRGEPRHRDLVDRIASLRRGTLRALWTDSAEAYPAEGDLIWWEVWLRRTDGSELARFLDFAAQVEVRVGERRLAFDDRLVVLACGTIEQLSTSLDVLNDLAEVRRAKESAAFFVDSSPEEQQGWIDDLRARTTPPDPDAPAVCVLDTGVTRAHPLLEGVIAPGDAMAADPRWGGQDDGGGTTQMGHGTQMAGLAAYGDLTGVLAGTGPVLLRHRVESVKILPPVGANRPEMYGAITAQAVSQAEVRASDRLRSFSMAIATKDTRDRGQPTAWSSAIDALAAGRSFDPSTHGLVYLDEATETSRRLIVVSAGNVDPTDLQVDHLDRSDVEAIHDPGHAWNALTVGAITERAVITSPDRAGWAPLARPGELSPWSTTSTLFDETWPIKPDVVAEGGNVGRQSAAIDFPLPDLSLLSTYYRPAEKPLVLTWATSAATPQVARIAAIIQADYPGYWPETVRALLVHSARWTPTMLSHLGRNSGRRDRAKLARRYGAGIPSLERALRSANDAVTLVAQSTIHPFSDGRMREMHLHELPWPEETLLALGAATVRLRVTLSYFVEPNPARRGWKKRHRYASHGLRFDVKSPTENVQSFRRRLNQLALDEDEQRPATARDSDQWFLGEQARNKGSIHSDVWTGSAADLAARGAIGVYPVSGWWKDQPRRDRSGFGARYSLVVTIETDAQDVDIWTPVAQEVEIPVEVSAL